MSPALHSLALLGLVVLFILGVFLTARTDATGHVITRTSTLYVWAAGVVALSCVVLFA
jgi:hypothetical protein